MISFVKAGKNEYFFVFGVGFSQLEQQDQNAAPVNII